MIAAKRSWSGDSMLAALVIGILFVSAAAGPINTNVALTPGEGASIFRLQYSFSEGDGPGPVRHANSSSVRATLVYGLRQDLSFLLTIPYANRQVDRLNSKGVRIEDAHDGVADIPIILKYRFWQRDDGPQRTARWAILGGLNVRSGDGDFTSDSYDPLAGVVFSWRRDRVRFDADLVYQFNTGGGTFRHDELRYDAAYSHRVWPATYESADAHEFDLVAELNGRYLTDGSHELLASPGVQYITQNWILEASVQLPVVQELATGRREQDYRLVMGIRYQN